MFYVSSNIEFSKTETLIPDPRNCILTMSTYFLIASISIYGLLSILEFFVLSFLCLRIHNKGADRVPLQPWTRNTGYGVLISALLLFFAMLCAYMVPLLIPELQNDSYYCDIEFRLRIFLIICYQIWLFYHWFGRIMYSFSGSMFSLKAKQKKLGLVGIAIIGVAFIVGMILFGSEPSTYENTFVCTPSGAQRMWKIYIFSLQFIIIFLNLTFSIIFMRKLRGIYFSFCIFIFLSFLFLFIYVGA